MNQDIVTEINTLKVQVRRQSRVIRISVVGWIGVTSLLLMGAFDGRLQNFRVSRLAIVDTNGVERLVLEADNSVAYTRSGEPRTRMSPVSGVILYNAQGHEMGGMMTDAAGNAGVALDSYIPQDPGIWDRVGLFSAADGTAGFKLNDTNKSERVIISSGPSAPYPKFFVQ